MKKQTADNYIVLQDPEKAEILKQSLIEKYGIEKGEVKNVFADEVSIQSLINEMRVLPLFSKKKLVHIKNCENINMDDCQLLKEYFEDPSPDVCLIISGDDIKTPLKSYLGKGEKEEKKYEGGFSDIYRMKGPADKKKVISLLKEYIRDNPPDASFPVVVNASMVYIRNIIRNKKQVDKKLLDIYNKLYNLDFDLKIGKIEKKDLDVFLFSIIDRLS